MVSEIWGSYTTYQGGFFVPDAAPGTKDKENGKIRSCLLPESFLCSGESRKPSELQYERNCSRSTF